MLGDIVIRKNMTPANSLKSTGISKLLMISLQVRLVITIIPTVFHVIPGMLANFDSADILIGFALQIVLSWLILIISSVIFVIWIYRIHIDLKNLFADYPITPSGALTRILIPLYNIWGFPNTIYTFAQYFGEQGIFFSRIDKRLKFLIQMFYGFTTASYILNSNSSTIVPAEIKPVLLILIDVALTVFILIMTKTMQSTLIQKATQEID